VKPIDRGARPLPSVAVETVARPAEAERAAPAAPPAQPRAIVDRDALAKIGYEPSRLPVVDGGGMRALDLRLGMTGAGLGVAVRHTMIAGTDMPTMPRAEAEALAAKFNALPEAEVAALGQQLEPLVRAAVDAVAEQADARVAGRLATAATLTNMTLAAVFLIPLTIVGGEPLVALARSLPLAEGVALLGSAGIAAMFGALGFGHGAGAAMYGTHKAPKPPSVETAGQIDQAADVAVGRLGAALRDMVLSIAARLPPTAAS
jgi:hypothetical protein